MRLGNNDHIVIFISLYDDEFHGIKCLNMLDYDWIWFGWVEVGEYGFKSNFLGEKTEKFSSNKFDSIQGFNLIRIRCQNSAEKPSE